jgi:integrase
MVSGTLKSIIDKLNDKGLTTVTTFLSAKARKSSGTSKTFYFVLDKFNDYIIKRYNGKYDIQTILPILEKKEIDVYSLIDTFINYLQTETRNGPNLTPKTITVYITAVRSYLQYNDVDIHPQKFKRKVVLPTLYRTDEEALDANDIREILNHCSNKRLKAYLLVLASGGMRAVEGLAIREQDLDFSGINFADQNDKSEPAGVTIRKEYSKTKTERKIFISNEAARYVHQWITWKYRNRPRNEEDLIFSKVIYLDTEHHPIGLYDRILDEFQKVLQLSGPALAARKKEGVHNRRRYTLHSFRRYVKTVIANQVNTDYSEWFLGHRKSPYYNNTDEQKKNIYKEKCMKYLTFLDYPTLSASARSIEDKLAQKDRELLDLRRREQSTEARMAELEQKYDDLANLYLSDIRRNTALLKQNITTTKKRTDETKKQTAEIEKRTDEINEMTNKTRNIIKKVEESKSE